MLTLCQKSIRTALCKVVLTQDKATHLVTLLLGVNFVRFDIVANMLAAIIRGTAEFADST